MGLNTTHNCWNGAYSSFMAFRAEICRASGYGNIRERHGFGGSDPWPAAPFGPRDRSGMHAAAEVDPLLVLLMHSDCDGLIPAALCTAIADRLDSILPNVQDFGWGRSHTDETMQFARGLRLAAERGEDVEFH